MRSRHPALPRCSWSSWLRGCAAGLVVGLAAGPARADEGLTGASSVGAPGAPRAWVDPPEERPSWYARSLLLTDAIGFGLGWGVTGVAYGLAPEDKLALGNRLAGVLGPVAGFASLVWTGPIVHMAHGNPRRALASFAVRVGLFSGALIAGLAARGTCSGISSDCHPVRMAGAMTGVMLLPAVFDAAAFSDTQRIPKGLRFSAPPAGSPRPGDGGPWVLPSVSALEGGVKVGLMGSF